MSQDFQHCSSRREPDDGLAEEDASALKHRKVETSSPFNKFLRAWAWKREHLPDKLRFRKPYKYPFDALHLNPEDIQQHAFLTIHQGKYQAEGFASTVWDSSIVLSKYFECHPEELRGMRFCDLSAGTGLVGIVAAKLGAKVVATDLDDNLPLLQQNISVNDVEIQACCHWWGTPVDSLDPPFDIIAACDVMYITEAIQALEKSLFLLAGDASKVYVAHGRNCSAEDAFLDLCTKRWNVERISDDELHPEYQADDVTVLRLTKK